MPLTPSYGETPLPHEELTALLAEVVDLLDKPITRADGYDLEQGLQDRVSGEVMPAAIDGSLPLDELLRDSFVRGLHTWLYGPSGTGPEGGDKPRSISVSRLSRSPSNCAPHLTPSATGGTTRTTGVLASEASP